MSFRELTNRRIKISLRKIFHYFNKSLILDELKEILTEVSKNEGRFGRIMAMNVHKEEKFILLSKITHQFLHRKDRRSKLNNNYVWV